MLLRGRLVENISSLDLFITNVKCKHLPKELLHVNPKGSLPTKSPEKRSSPLKLELNACQESLHNFYIGTNNIQHLERELLSSNFHSVFLHD